MKKENIDIEMIKRILNVIGRIIYKLVKVSFRILTAVIEKLWQASQEKPSSMSEKVPRENVMITSGSKNRYCVTIKGTAQSNGPLPIRKTVVMDASQAKLFRGANRYDAIQGWVQANYPGAKIPHIRDFAVEIKPIED